MDGTWQRWRSITDGAHHRHERLSCLNTEVCEVGHDLVLICGLVETALSCDQEICCRDGLVDAEGARTGRSTVLKGGTQVGEGEAQTSSRSPPRKIAGDGGKAMSQPPLVEDVSDMAPAGGKPVNPIRWYTFLGAEPVCALDQRSLHIAPHLPLSGQLGGALDVCQSVHLTGGGLDRAPMRVE